MSRPFPSALALTRLAVRLLIVANIVLAGLILVLFVASLVAPVFVFTALGAGPANDRLIAGMRAIMVIGIGSAPIAHILLTRLLAIVESVRVGDPFIPGNAARLQTIAWALFGLEVLHLVVGAVAAVASTAAQRLDIHWRFSVTGWLAVLLLFVLARVFDYGTRMRDDLEGTV